MSTRQHTPEPHYDITSRIDGDLIGDAHSPIGDPFVRHTITLDPRDLRTMADAGKPVEIEVIVGGDRDAMLHVMNPRPIEVSDDPTVQIASGMEDAGPAAPGVDTSDPNDHGMLPDRRLIPTVGVTRTLLLLVDAELTHVPDEDEIRSWHEDVRYGVAQWAGAVHLSASDNDNDVPPRPDVLR